MADFAEVEAMEGVRMPWNVWPATKLEAAKCVVPPAIVYTPLRTLSTPLLPYAPLRCKSCRSILNPYCVVDFQGRIWICPFCFQRNHFPDHYMGISPSNLPAELFPQYTTIEYASQPPAGPDVPPVFLFLLDTCMAEDELGYLKTALTQAVGLLPGNALVGLITFGTLIHVHELGFSEVPKSYVFRGSKDVTKEQILDQLELMGSAYKGRKPVGVIAGVRDGLSADSIKRYLLPVSDCEFTFNSVLDELQRDPWPAQSDQRAARCTSTALTVAAGLLGACVPGSGARILAFLSGPCTEGSGMIVSKDLSEPLRSHKDLDKGAATHYKKAVKFYETLSRQLVNQGHVLDLFACSLDQVGVAELKVAVERTGGLAVLAESFGHSVFKESFRRVFEAGDAALGLSYNGIFEINCSRDIKIQGIIGPCTSLEKKGIPSSEIVIGQGDTTAWKMCGLDKNTTFSIFFEVIPKEITDVVSQTGVQQFYFQFLTHYQHIDGNMRTRCSTVTRKWVDSTVYTEELVSGFDQETAAVVMARLASLKMETEDEFDATKWLDRSLIRLSSRFGDYRKDDPSSFSLSSRFAIFPQFMFNLRRSQFVQVFNNSPDETAYFRMLLNRETIVNSVVMIQPSLISYSFMSPPEPVLLDVAAIAADRILLLDTFFTLVIFHGVTIAEWRKAEYQKQPEHQAFAQLLQAPHDDGAAIMRERFPVPRLVICDQHGSQARFLLARLNPSATYKSSSRVVPGGDIIFTDDVSFEVFLEHLQKLAVSQSQ